MGQNTRKYRAKAKEWGLGQASTGTKQIAVNFEVTTPDATEKSFTWYGFFSDAAWERTYESLQHMGWEGEDPLELQNHGGGLDKNEVELVIEDEEYPAGSGKFSAKVRWVNKIGVALNAPLQPADAAAFSAAMREKIRAKKAAVGQPVSAPKSAAKPPAPSQPAGPPEPPPLTDADVPF